MENLIKQVSDHEVRIRDNETKSAKMEVRMDTAEKKIDVFDSINLSIVRITATLEQLQESNKRQDKLLALQTETLSSLTAEIKTMNLKIDNTNKDLNELKKKVDDNISKGSVSFNSLFKKFGIAGIGALATLVVGWLGWKLGIKK